MGTRLIVFIAILFTTIPSMGLSAQEKEKDAAVLTADSLVEEGLYEEAVLKYNEYIDSRGKIKEHEKGIVADCYMQIGFCFYKLDNYDAAIGAYGKALEIQKELDDLESVSNTLNNIGLSYRMRGKFDTAIEYYEEAVKIDEELGNVSEIAITYNNIGMIYRNWGKYDKAIEYFEHSMRLKKNLNDAAGMAKTLNNIGLVYTEWKKYDQAIISFRESLEMEESTGDETEMAKGLNNLGRVYFKMNQYDTALVYFEKALEIFLKYKDQDQIALEYNNIGRVYLAHDQYKEALHFLSSALGIYKELGMAGETATVMANLSEIYRKTGNLDKALQMIDSSTSIATKLNARSQLQQNYLYFSDIYSDRREFEKSLEYFKKFNSLKDSVFNKEILSQLTDFQVKYEKEKDQARILALEKENLARTLQRNAYLFTGMGLVILAFFMIIYFRQRAYHIKIITDQKIRQLEEEKKLMAAKLLVEGQEEERKRIATELHDGLGVLLSATKMQFSVIRDKSPENKDLIERATRMLEQASGDVRKISHNMMPGLLTRLGFYEAVEDLFEHIGDTEGLKAVCNITGSQERLPENKEIMLYRIIQEMVNNTLKHAKANKIDLQVDVKPGIMDLVYQDDGIGYDINEKLESESIGLKSIQSRVSFLNGKIDFLSKPGEGVKYTIRINL